ncbi:UNVERIFIED_CONTAM: putative inactive ATP-dependent zinc metalloprotease FTSHI 3, chloroplastic [Sesamum calycinum]|uniref:Inactive ATP-dependent zinc metalloprotease FTSHI 3, chloroplastic n=1 Tax=Sesamum calycinum TaxID=2727403 RepID=A0AAW2MMU8_9LAMI
MASFPLAWNDGFLIAQENLNLCVGNSKLLGGHRNLSFSLSKNCFSSVSCPLLLSCSSHKRQNRLLCSNRIKLVVNEKINIDTQLVKRGKDELRRKFSLRLRPRIRLLSRRLKRVPVSSLLDGLGTFLRKNVKRVTLSTSVSIVLGLCFLFLKITAIPTPKVVPYSDLIMSLQNGNVAKVLFEEGTRRIYYNTKLWSEKGSETEVDKSSSYGDSVLDNNADEDVARDNLGGKILLTLWIPLTPLMWLLYRQLSAANSPAKKRRPSNQLVCFEDVEGVDSAKVELMEIVCCLRGSINYSKLGAKLPRGVLLVGPPGTGKTLLARAVAGEAGVPFFSVSASEFVELFVGRGAARIRDLFSVARKNAPSIIFIDELDAVGGKRGRSFNDERDQTLNQLLTEMDGFESDINVVVIAATNRPEALDPALCRPGRFSRKVYVGEPDEVGRKKILAIHLRGVPLEEDVGLICNLVASLTQGFVGADLANIVNEAALLAARRGAETVSREDIMEAIERAKFGINERQTSGGTISKELTKLFPWMPSLLSRNDTRRDGSEGPVGYQTLS